MQLLNALLFRSTVLHECDSVQALVASFNKEQFKYNFMQQLSCASASCIRLSCAISPLRAGACRCVQVRAGARRCMEVREDAYLWVIEGACACVKVRACACGCM